MQLTHLSSLYDEPGPFATAYLDASRADESGAREVALRWRELREDLAGQGAPDAALEAMDAAVEAPDSTPGDHGRVLVATGDRVVFDAVLRDPPRSVTARWARLPHLMPFVAQEGPLLPHVVVRVDSTGGDVRTFGGETTPGSESVDRRHESDARSSHEGGSRKRDQHASDEEWERSAKEVAADVDTAVQRTGAVLVAVYGDVRAVTLLKEHLGSHASSLVRDVEHPDAVDEDVTALLAAVDTERIERVLDEYGRERGRGEAATDGLAETIGALRMAAVETLVLRDDEDATGELFIGPGGLDLALTEQELRDTGIDDITRDRVDAALVRALATGDAAIAVLPQDRYEEPTLADGVGAVLRYPVQSTATAGGAA